MWWTKLLVLLGLLPLPRDLELVVDAYRHGRWVGALITACGLFQFHFLCLVLMAVLTVFEAIFRLTNPSQFFLAVFPPACVLMFFALGSRSLALLFGSVLGIVAGIWSRDGGAAFSYVVPNVVQALAFTWLSQRYVRCLKPGLSFGGRLLGILAICVVIGGILGAIAQEITVRYWYNQQPSWPMWQIALHWAFGDFTACLLVAGGVAAVKGRQEFFAILQRRIAR